MRDNVAYDKFAHDVLSGRSAGGLARPTPADTAAAASRVFLGVRLECAQCHNHPFAKWKKEQFWEFAAFFNRGEVKIANSEKVVKARVLVGETPPLKEGADARAALADWATRPDNPFFARAAVNRLWMHFFGVGLVDPVDALGEEQSASHPELLDDLAKEFAAHHFDVRFLIRAITASKTYQLDGAADGGADDPRLFARAGVRGLSAEQLFDSLAVATGKGVPLNGPEGEQVLANAFGPRAEFLARFPPEGRPLEAEASILQALHLMNGKPMADATSLRGNRLLQTVADSERPTARKVEELYLLALARKPRPEESERLVKYVESGGARGDPKQALADVLWVLLNSAEFRLNH
jgi:hypothetical protein